MTNLIIHNEIDANIGEHGLLFYADPINSNFTDNTITVYPSQTPLNVDCLRTDDNITLSN
ncbi:hypothetical protein [Olleya sp. HaHaR_3_96]|uniref:hypothetical protein n=1 Tax=Olleya sp. HaHaR_3_96 TaxID=2745560 RepID=UPI001C4E9EFE|nr:hypothetical protein [Olleya sp. HaHaR_3_96]QXP61741.1 hypothetical protein H0I26_08970 [Olleya sp. HaHaR_3_96]